MIYAIHHDASHPNTCTQCAKVLRDRADNIPEELDRISDTVLAYRPKPKTKASKRRVRRKKYADNKAQKRESSI